MSDAKPMEASAAMDIEEYASVLLQRRHFWTWSDADQRELDAWLARSIAHRVAYVRLESAWRRTGRLAALRAAGEVQEAKSTRRASIKVAVIAVAVIAFGLGAALLLSQPREETYATSVGGHKTVLLADGSRVELSTDTVLRVTTDHGSRTAWLDKGEAFFQIKHDAAHPFVVITQGARVTDLGTAFLVRRDAERLEVALIEGRVKFDAADADGRPSAMLKPGDEIVATANTVFVTRQSPRKLSNELGWRRGVLVFDNTTLADAAAEFNRYNHMKMIIADPAVARLTIDGTFPTSDVQAFTAVTQHILGLHTERYSDEVVISR